MNNKTKQRCFIAKLSLHVIKISVFFILFCTVVFPQTEALNLVRNFDHHLSGTYTNSIAQDSFGFMWFGTKNGLVRYDGRNVKIYNSVADDSTSLASDQIQTIFTDSLGNLWIAANGLHRYNFEKDNFFRIELPLFDSLTLKLKFITSIRVDNQNNLWIGTFGQGLYKFSPVSGKIEYIKLGETFPLPFKDYIIYSISIDNSGSVWVASSGHQITSINTNTQEQTRYRLEQRGDIQNIIADRRGNLWLTAIGEPLKRIQALGGRLIVLESYDEVKSENFFIKPIDDLRGNIWLGTQSEGVFVFNPEKKSVRNFRHNSRDENSLPADFIEEIFEDRAGNIWISTNKGLCKWSRWKKPFRHIQYDTENLNSIGSSEVTGIDEDDDDNLWISTFNTGFSKLNLKSGSVTRYDPSTSKIKTPWALEILYATDGTVWIATNFQHGLNRLDTRTGSFKEYLNKPRDESSISSNIVTLLFQDSRNQLWIGAERRGLNLYDPLTDSFNRFQHNPADTNSLSSNKVYAIFEDNESGLWIGTDEGLDYFDQAKGIFTNYYPPEFINDTTKSFAVFSICNSAYRNNKKNQNFWLGTSTGLYLFDKNEKRFLPMPRITGSQDSIIYGVLEDEVGNLWLQTISALVKFSSENKTYRVYNRYDGWIQTGVAIDEWRNSYKKLKSGEMVFGGLNGITIFYPEQINDNPDIAPVHITRFSLFNKPVEINGNPFGSRETGDSILTKSIIFTDEIILNHDENSFTFNFASLDFTNPFANQFMYKLEGFNKDWINTSNSNSASFTNIPPGEYKFFVKASNSDGVWNEKGASIKVFVLPPWWLTTYAYISYVIVLLIILYWIRRFELNRMRTRDQLKMKELETKKFQEVDQMKSRLFANISHEFRTPLTLILGILDKYLNKTGQENSDFKIMKKNADRSLQLINQLLELSRLESGSAKMHVQKTEINRFLRRIASSFISLAEQKRIDFRFNNYPLESDHPEDEVFAFIDRKKIETIVYNLLSNAFKFTPEEEKISIYISSTISASEISITNSGITIPVDELPYVFDRFYQGSETAAKNYEGTGIGLALVKELVELHQGQVKVISGENETTFKINLPAGVLNFSSDQDLNKDAEISIENPALIYENNEIAFDRKESGLEKKESGIVLVVEDHFDLRNFICEQIEDDYTVIEAEHGKKGLLLAEELLPDLIISDVMMPEMDGFELCKEIKSNFKTNHIPVILLTAKAALENKLEGLETGADDYLIKPFNTEELKARVRNLIHLRRQMREKFRSEMILKPADVIVPSNQRIFIEKLTSIIEKNIEDDNFSVEILSKEIGMSRSQLHRKVKALTNQPPNEFIRNFRLKRASDLIRQNAGNIAEISYKVGFGSQAYFTKLFQEMYGVTPTEFRKQLDNPEIQFTSQE